MVDELKIANACKEKTKGNTREGTKTHEFYEVDFSYLRQYENIHFVLCLRPFVESMKDFELKLPAAQEGQLYKILDFRHRNAYEILLFMRFWQETDPGLTQNQSLTIKNEQILDKLSLSPLIEGLDYGVIWIFLKYEDSAKERNFLFHNIEKILQKINNQIF